MDIPQQDWSLEAYPFEWKSDPVQQQIKVRSLIFILTGVCAGLPALVWSVSDIIHHRKNGFRISIFIILLLLNDFTELFLSPYILIKVLLNEFMSSTVSTFWDMLNTFSSAVWLSTRVCGFVLNHMVVLDGILESPLCTASVLSSRYCIAFYILVFLSITISSFWSYSIMFLIYISILIFFAVLFFVITLAISCALLCSCYCCFHTSSIPDRHIWLVFIFSLMIYISYFLSFSFLVQNIPVFFLSLRLISDPLLCVLVCQQNLSLQNSQNPEESEVQSE